MLAAPSVGPFSSRYPVFMKGALVLAWVFGSFSLIQKTWLSVASGWVGWDAHAYWLAARGDLIYSRSGGEVDAYLYSPAFAMAIHPLALLEWPLFYGAWIILQSCALLWLLRPLPRKWSIPLFFASVPELVNGNIFVLLAACAAIGLARPGLYSFALLTKITPGVGLLWFLGRRHWAALAKAVCVTAAVAGASYLLSPAGWQAWLAFLVNHGGSTPDGLVGFGLRCLLAAMLVLYAARKNLPWLIAPALVISCPIFDFPVLTLLTAIPRLSMPAPGTPGRPSEQGVAQH